ncbi:hypothetical protein BJ138DRAFT_1162191 [Hygrophoropsis aurantiaca]|uniref:Uncharacterized protein n=1 Tax=Hygrophoropsis aurantiaca TaxID=72124 RepID=A0ACB7ZZM6_9AGAM|nr:hypothetical protein BJ138DRAFT_1162191 [Hygrophoropsis aurantiaca]
MEPNLELSGMYEHHKRFYFSDGNVIFLVGSTLYKVHRYFFEYHSAFFNAMFSLPIPSTSNTMHLTQEGQSDDNPIVLKDVNCFDFDSLLGQFYPSDFVTNEAKTVEDWKAIFAIASKWDFLSLKGLAQEKLSYNLPVIDAIVMARRYPGELDDWLETGFTYLCQRSERLTVTEGRQLGLDESIIINNAQHDIHVRGYWSGSLVEIELPDSFPKQLSRSPSDPYFTKKSKKRSLSAVEPLTIADVMEGREDHECSVAKRVCIRHGSG